MNSTPPHYRSRSPYRQAYYQRYTPCSRVHIDLLAHDWTESEILRNYPGLTHEDIQAYLMYVSDLLRKERVYSVEISQEVD